MSGALQFLADLGAASTDVIWLPLAAWTLLSILADGALRLGRASASVGLHVRGALVALMPAVLVVPPLLAPWLPSLRSASSTAPPLAPAVAPDPLALSSGDALAASGAAAASGGVANPSAAASVPAVDGLDLALGMATVAAVLLAVAALGVLAGGLWWLHRYRRDLAAVPADVANEAHAVASELGVRRALDVAWSEPASSPFTVGWRRPVVAVPPDLTGESLRLALAHEIAHVRDGHYGWTVAERVVRAVFVWHPLVHVLGCALALDRERAADATVVRLWPERARTYGTLLASFSTRPSPALALGASSSPLVHRLTAMTRLSTERRHLARLAGAVALLLPLVLAASAVPDPQPPADPVATPAEVAAPVAEADTIDAALDARIESRRVSYTNGRFGYQLGLTAGTTRAQAQAIADYYSSGETRSGRLLVVGDGFQIERSTVRLASYPPPPPPPPPP
ncbi:MAG: M56 family metallopeptidase, partial [Bacteroidota bacterium]